MILRIALFLGLLQCASQCFAAPETRIDTTHLYDWVPYEDLNEAQKARLGPACRGIYVDPLAGQPATDPATTEILVEAGKSNMANGQISLEDNVIIRQGARKLRAETMFYDQASGDASLKGQVEIRQPGVWVQGDKAQVNLGSNHAQFTGGEFVLHETHLRGAAGSIEQRSDGLVVLRDGMVTSCEPGSESWVIQGDKLSINPHTNQGSGRNVAIKMGGVPVFYAPYLTFPVGSQRQSGLLVPAIGTSEGGLDLTIPWYWNIAPNMDATLAPRYAAGHGAMLEAEYRLLNRFSENALSFAYLANDEGGGDPDVDAAIAGGLDENLLRPYKGEDRWLVDFDHKGGGATNWYSDINYTRASDIDYFRDLAVASFEVANNTYLSQGALFGYSLPNWHLRARLQDYQTLLADVDEAYRQVPRLNATGKYPVAGAQLNLNQEYVRFTHENPNFIVGDRLNLDYQLSWEKRASFGFVNPNLGVQALAYNLQSDALRADANTQPAYLTPYASLDTGLVFERAGGLQTLEPRIYYLYRDYRDQSDLYNVLEPGTGAPDHVNFDTTPLTFSYHQLFRDRRFSGGDRLDDANQLTLSLSSRLMASHDSAMALDVSFGQIIYFDDRQVTLFGNSTEEPAESDLAAQVSATLNESVRLYSNFLYNPKTKLMMRATNGVEYRGANERMFNIGYRYVREDTVSDTTLPVDQLDTSIVWPIGDQWQLVARWFYDLKTNKDLDTFVGFEYDDCCYRVRLLARRWLDSKLAALVTDRSRLYDEALFLEIDLKGLASSGESIKRLLSDSIRGFSHLQD